MTGHLPGGYSDSGPRVGADHAEDRRAATVSQSAGAGPIALAQLVSDLRLLTAKAYAVTRSSWDPRTGPQQCDPYSESDVDIRMSAIGADLRSALSGLDGLRSLTSFPVDAVAPGAGGRPAGMGVAILAGTSSPVGPGSEPTPGSALASDFTSMAATFVLPKPQPWHWPDTTPHRQANAPRTSGPAWPTG